jgi:xanthine dehydrogenase accessory factor
VENGAEGGAEDGAEDGAAEGGRTMRDIAQELSTWSRSGKRFAVATIVRTWNSAPRRPGASMAVAEDGEVVGSVSGGCVEGAVYELAREVLSSGEPAMVAYGVSDDDALTVGLTCGGTIQILVRPAGAGRFAGLPHVLDAIESGRPVAVATPLEQTSCAEGVAAGVAEGIADAAAYPYPRSAGPAGPAGSSPSASTELVITSADVTGTLGDSALDAAVAARARNLLALGRTAIISVERPGLGQPGQPGQLGWPDRITLFVESFAPPPRLLVFGAIDFAASVARIGKFLGYHVTVCDARPVFATRTRFPDVDELVVSWPHRYLEHTEVDENTVICVLTHDPKFDLPLLELALRSPARYIGAMGSRRTHEDRMRRLREAGLRETELARLASPIGLDLGAETPEETAVAIMAELIALQRGGTGFRLVDTAPEPIHN